MPDVEQSWTRWHSDGWVLTVTRTADGRYAYRSQQDGQGDAAAQPASTLAEAQHKAEDIVRGSGHRCVARCSFWVPDQPDED